MPILTSNNVASAIGDVLIVSFASAFKDIESLNSISEVTYTETAERYFKREVRWSSDGLSFSSWLLGNSPLLGSYVGTAFVGTSLVGQFAGPWGEAALSDIPLEGCDDIWLEIRYTRVGTDASGNLILSSVDVNMTSCNTQQPEIPPILISCDNPNYCTGIKVACDDLLWNPYTSTNKILCLYSQINESISDMFGHCVKYFKTDARGNTRDVILKEYTIYEVSAVKDIKVLVPNNEFPEDDLRYSPYDVGFEEPFEIHITKEEFCRAFGQDRRPEQRDYLYFPLMDRMWEISSAFVAKTFQEDSNFYKVQLFKWQDKVNVIRGATADSIVDDLTLNFDDVFKDEKDAEFTQITKPLQYNTISTGAYDFVRSVMNLDLIIVDDDINNYWTIIAKYYYDLSTVTFNDLSVKYKTKANIPTGEDRVLTGWFNDKRNWATGLTALNVPIIDGYDETDSSGFKFNATYGATAQTINGFELVVGSTAYTFNTLFPEISTDKWYGFVVNIDNSHEEISFNLWEMTYDPILYNQSPTTKQTTDLKLVYSESKIGLTFNENPIDTYYELRGSTISLTNIRVLNKVLEEDKQPLFLNQYVVKENQYAQIIDNALPRLRYPRENVR
jgi:hypothetical protein